MTLFDSGWVFITTGSISAGIDTSDVNTISVIFAASGTNGMASAFMGWTAGTPTPFPWRKWPSGTVAPTGVPAISGTYSVAAPAANATSSYRIGVGQSGTSHLDDYLHDTLTISGTQGAASWGRIIVEGH